MVLSESSRRRFGVLAVVVAACLLVALPLRRPILALAGRALVVDEPIARAEMIVVVGVSADVAAVLEAGDLVHSGVANQVALFANAQSPAERELLRRGWPYEDDAARSMRQLRSLGVADIQVIRPHSGSGTETEGRILPGWCDLHGLRSIVVVSAPDHSRRLRRVLRRAMQGHQTTFAMRSARFSIFDPDHWWESRDGVRIEVVEMQKLLFDVARHPFS